MANAEIGGIGTLEGRLEFERIVGEVAAAFVNLQPGQVDAAIVDALERIGRSLDLDRCSVFEIAGGDLVMTHNWRPVPEPPSPDVVSARKLFPWSFEKIVRGEMVVIESLDALPDAVERETLRYYGTKSRVSVPLSITGNIVGCISFSSIRETREWPEEILNRLRLVAQVFASAIARRKADISLERALDEVKQLRDQLYNENIYLRREVQERFGTGPVVGQSAAVKRVLDLIGQVAVTDSTVLLLGETGTGKELFATQIHEQSPRRGRTMVRVNCAAIPGTLIESELFGREKGAFTGALARQIGRFEFAEASTIFLDEIGDLPPEVQVKLLRVIEERQVERLGSPRSIPVNVRLIAATHRNLEQRVSEGLFREDLFYRLNVFPVQVPPLRERPEDIPLLVWRFVEEFSKAFGKHIESISRENMAALQRYPWPGNIRELRNVVERAMIVAPSPRLSISVPTLTSQSARRYVRLDDVEREHIRTVLESTAWRVRGDGGAADRLGLKPTTLETRMAKLGLNRPKPS